LAYLQLVLAKQYFSTRGWTGQCVTWQLATSEPESISNDLLVHSTLDLKGNLVHSHPASPVVETALSFAHSDLPSNVSKITFS
jgi:hypothetical protein